MSLNELISKLNISLKQYPLKNAYLFGSFSRQEQTDESDIDLLVEFNTKVTLFYVLKMERDLEKLLNRKIDLIERDALKASLKKHIENELVLVYEA